jgi:hypothetical protein
MLAPWATLILAATSPLAPPTTLTGSVLDARGQPVPNAHVFISTAAPRRGVGVL